MKQIILVILSSLIFITCSKKETQKADNIFVLDPSQNMLMTGKGPGQDGSINPYFGQDSYAIVKNLDEVTFSIRIQENGSIVDTLLIEAFETRKIALPKGQELYVDSNEEQQIKVQIDYEKMEYNP